jgi:uncharacterized repeat protein (TIGR03803 family)
MNTNGAGGQVLHQFDGRPEGSRPFTGLTLSADGTLLFGTTAGDVAPDFGPGRYGTIFQVKPDGSQYTVLHGFTGPPGDSAYASHLTQVGNALYGTTPVGGDFGFGGVFSLDLNSRNFQILHSFNLSEGTDPGGLSLVDNKFVGTLSQGGDFGQGAVFSIKVDGNAFEILHMFAGGATDGANPQPGLTVDGLTIYGATGGGPSDKGTIFAIALPEPGSFVLAAIGALALLAVGRPRRRRHSN